MNDNKNFLFELPTMFNATNCYKSKKNMQDQISFVDQELVQGFL